MSLKPQERRDRFVQTLDEFADLVRKRETTALTALEAHRMDVSIQVKRSLLISVYHVELGLPINSLDELDEAAADTMLVPVIEIDQMPPRGTTVHFALNPLPGKKWFGRVAGRQIIRQFGKEPEEIVLIEVARGTMDMLLRAIPQSTAPGASDLWKALEAAKAKDTHNTVDLIPLEGIRAYIVPEKP